MVSNSLCHVRYPRLVDDLVRRIYLLAKIKHLLRYEDFLYETGKIIKLLVHCRAFSY